MGADSAKGRRLGTVDAPPERTGGDVPPLPPMGRSLAILAVVVMLAGVLFGVLLAKHMPRAGWLAFAAGLVALWGLPRYLPGLREREALRKARKEAKRLLKAVRDAMKKQKAWTGEGVREKLDEASATLAKAIPGNDLAAIEFASKQLDELADKHLARKGAMREYVEQIGGAVLAALILRAFFYEAFRIPSGSMEPTLLIGDHLFVNKFVYGLRIPIVGTKLFAQVPQRGDIVVFSDPRDPSADDLIKRVIGLPGDTVIVDDPHVTVCPSGENCAEVPWKPGPVVQENESGDLSTETDDGPFFTARQFTETLGKHVHVAQGMNGSGPSGKWVVPPGHVFMMGDNRDNSMDSRFGPEERGFGMVPIEVLKGRADIIWLSLGGPHGLRFSRLFHLLD